MGEAADDLIEGACCERGCGTYFESEHGYPVICRSCWANMSKGERKGHQRATEQEAT